MQCFGVFFPHAHQSVATSLQNNFKMCSVFKNVSMSNVINNYGPYSRKRTNFSPGLTSTKSGFRNTDQCKH